MNNQRLPAALTRAIPLIALFSLQAGACNDEREPETASEPTPGQTNDATPEPGPTPQQTADDMRAAGGGTCGAMFASLPPETAEEILRVAEGMCAADVRCDEEPADPDRMESCVLQYVASMTSHTVEGCPNVYTEFWSCAVEAYTECKTGESDGATTYRYLDHDPDIFDACYDAMIEQVEASGCTPEHITSSPPACEGDYSDYEYYNPEYIDP